jgi:hypothetical protein
MQLRMWGHVRDKVLSAASPPTPLSTRRTPRSRTTAAVFLQAYGAALDYGSVLDEIGVPALISQGRFGAIVLPATGDCIRQHWQGHTAEAFVNATIVEIAPTSENRQEVRLRVLMMARRRANFDA